MLDNRRVAQHAALVTPSDTTTFRATMLYVGTGGTALNVRTVSGEIVAFVNVPDGTTIPLECDQVRLTGTIGAADIVRLW